MTALQALEHGSVPVYIYDGTFCLPYSATLDWSTFAVLVPASELPHLKDLLLSIPPSQVKYGFPLSPLQRCEFGPYKT